MNDLRQILLVVSLAGILLLLGILILNIEIGTEIKEIQTDKDLVLTEIKTIKNDLNQVVFYVAYAVQQEQQATKFLEGCKVLQDNNSSVVLSCLR